MAGHDADQYATGRLLLPDAHLANYATESLRPDSLHKIKDLLVLFVSSPKSPVKR